MVKKLAKKRSGESFNFGIMLVLLTIGISAIAFISENNKLTGFATSAKKNEAATKPSLTAYRDINSLGVLATGNYYVDASGVVYWVNDEQMTPVAKVNYLDDYQKNVYIYIDDDGSISYQYT